ncbi:MAG: hypothetical protein OHK0029_34960 [Armatimonadaceae bacterium]
MDTFSWFRQRRQSPPGRPLSPASEIRIPLMPSPSVSQMVFCRFGSESEIPNEREAETAVENWIMEHSTEPLRAAVLAFFRQGNLGMELHDRGAIPEPPVPLLRAFAPGETEERRFRDATHVVLIEASDLLLSPRVGLWTAIAAARALTEFLPGAVLLDPEFPRLMPLEMAQENLPENGYLRLVDHILIPYSQDSETGQMWMTTRGMARFGLPDLELHGVPPNLVSSLMPVLNGLAQRLTESAMRTVYRAVSSSRKNLDRARVLSVPAEFSFGLSDIRRAYAHSDAEIEQMRQEDNRVTEEFGMPGESVVRLSLYGGTRRQPPLLRVVPPRAEGDASPTETGVFLHTLLNDLFGSDPQLATVVAGDEEIEAAHQRAIEELPLVRSRYQAGFRSGETLHIKTGFPIPNETQEYMWIAVTGWRDGRIRGQLANEPQYRRDLQAGQSIEIGEEDVFDWLIVHPNGLMEGAFTNHVLNDQEDDDLL